MRTIQSVLAALLATALLTGALAGCTSGSNQAGKDNSSVSQSAVSDNSGSESTDTQAVTIKAAVLKGPTAIGMLNLMQKAKNKTAKQAYDFSVYAAPDQVTAALIKGELDMAALPTNAGALLYNKTEGKIQIAAVNTLGVLYLLENSAAGDDTQKGNPTAETTDLSYLKGQTLNISGKGSTPQYVLEYLLGKNNLTAGKDVTVDYQTEHAGTMANLVSGKVRYAVLPQPFATVAQSKNPNVKIVTDLNAAWEKTSGSAKLVMGCLLVRKEFADAHPQAVQTMLEEYATSATFATNQVEETAALCGTFDIMDAKVAVAAIPKCAVTSIVGSEMKTMVSAYLNVLAGFDKTSVGGKLPGDDFYYGVQ